MTLDKYGGWSTPWLCGIFGMGHEGGAGAGDALQVERTGGDQAVEPTRARRPSRCSGM
jgi:hypothetical protein